MERIQKTLKFSVSSGLVWAMLLFLISCSQSRLGIGKEKKNEVWGAQQVCDIMSGSELLGCFSVELNISANEANISVIDLGINPMEVPYRVLARRPEDVAFTILADNVVAGVGRSFTAKAVRNHYIEAYEEWRFETTKAIATDGLGYVNASAGRGVPMAQVMIYWPELSLPAPK